MDRYGDTLFSQSKQQRYRLTREKMLEIIGKTEATIAQGITIQEFEPFFAKFRLQVRVFDACYNLSYEYDPPFRNHNNKTLYCLAKNNHIYTLNYNLKSLEQKMHDDEDGDEEVMVVRASTDYRVIEDRNTEYCRMITNIEDILEILKEEIAKQEEAESPESKTVFLAVANDEIKRLFFHLKAVGYEPIIKYECNRITGMYMTFNGINFAVRSQQLITSSIEREIAVDSEKVFSRLNEEMNKFHDALFKNRLKSYYNQQDLDILDEYRTVANIGMLADLPRGTPMREMDVRKAFTAAFQHIRKVPIFNIFDVWKPYRGGEIKELSLYVLKSRKHNMFLNKTYNLCFGMHLCKLNLERMKKNPAVAFEIVAYKEPSQIIDVDFQKIVGALFHCYNKISDDEEENATLKKLIANVNYGLLEKSQNTRAKSVVFNSIKEAKHFQVKYGGTLNTIQEYEVKEEEVHTNYHADLDTGINFTDDGDDPDDVKVVYAKVFHSSRTGKEYSVLTVSDTKALMNGFRYIKELLLQNHNYFIFESHEKLKKYGVEVYSVKNDAFTIKAEDFEKATSLVKFEEGFGSWRLSKEEGIIYPTNKLTMKESHEVEVKPIVVNKLQVPDEFDTESICRQLVEHRRVILKAKLPGCGKSYACKRLEDLGHNVLFVCPTNELCKNNLDDGVISVTVHTFFGCGISEDVKVSRFDDSRFDVVVFDEVYLCDLKFLTKIKHYCDEHPDKLVLGTGDTLQNEPINPLSTQFEHDTYANHIMSIIFPSEIFLQVNKRLNNEADKKKLIKLQEDLFDESKDVYKTLRENFKFTKTIDTANNVSYRNNIAEEISNHVRKNQNRQSDYEVGEQLLCNAFYQTSGYKKLKNSSQVEKVRKFNCNKKCRFEVAANDGETITLKAVQYDFVHADSIDPDDDITVIKTKGDHRMISFNIYLPIKKALVAKHFIYGYCRTGHSLQGVTIRDKITVCDWRYLERQDPVRLRKWLYVAITRATSLDDVQIFAGGNAEFNDQLWKLYLKKKVVQYKEQDKRANREMDPENYITEQWLDDNLRNVCIPCNCTFDVSFKECKVSCNLTADRVDNDRSHELDNIVPCCTSCNVRKVKR
jgi:hypothetical protein